MNGGFGTIPFCTQLIADLFNKPVRLRRQFHSVSFGAYLLSATEMGIYKTLDDAAKTVELPDVFKPNKQHHAIYADYFGLFEKLSTKLFDEFETIGELQHKYSVNKLTS